MYIFQSELFLRTRDDVPIFPFVRYVMPDGVARDIEAEILHQYPHATYTLSHFNSYERRTDCSQPLGKKRIAIYRHGAIGDTLISTALVSWLRRRNPQAVLDVYCRPKNVELWHGVGARAMPGYPTFDALTRYDGHLMFENMLECDSEPDQGCAIDAQFRFCGIDPTTVPDEEKVPVVVEKGDDALESFQSSRGTYILLHTNASNPNRNYPHNVALMDALALAFPDHHVVAVGDGCGVYPRFRNLIPIVKNAALVICPDSSVGHLAAAFPSVPVISLWGLFHPNDRVKYYRNHHPLSAFEACPHAPCRSHMHSLPLEKCRDAASNGPALAMYDRPGGPLRIGPNVPSNCAALRAITPEMIVAKAKELLKL